MGKGSEIKDVHTLKKRARRKVIGQTFALKLINVSEYKENIEMQNSYWNTYHCLKNITSVNNKYYGNYCKNRCCPICCGIRKANLLNRYMPVLREWEDPYFLTLTLKSVPYRRLAFLVRKMKKALRQILNKHKKRHQRGKGCKFIGIYSLECNFNPNKKTYNPHFHLVLASEEIGDLIREDWINKWGRKYVNPDAQVIKRVYNKKGMLVELIKYCGKIFKEVKPEIQGSEKVSQKVYVAALDNIFTAFKGLRLFDRFGFNLPQQKQPTDDAFETRDYKEWSFDLNNFDWIENSTEEKFTNYQPYHELMYILQTMDVELE